MPNNTAKNSIPPLAKIFFILKSTHHPTNKLIVGICGQISPPCGATTPKVCPPFLCPLFGNIWINVIIYDKEEAPLLDRTFLQKNMVLFSSRGREIRTPDLLPV